MKRCPRCGEEKESTEFHSDRAKKDGLATYCKTCNNISRAIFRKRETMNQTNFERLYRGLSAQAKKVYDAIPISDPWKAGQIMGELHRNQSGMNAHVALGCANSLIACGLVVESPKGSFKRVKIHQVGEAKEPKPEPKTEPQKETEMKQIETTQASGGAMEMLGNFAEKLRALASEAEVIAMEIAGQAEKNEAETAKMRQLQALLKSLG